MNSISIQTLQYEHASDGKRAVCFSNGINILFSQINSVGKTTLIRILLYAMGFDVKGTTGVNFEYLKYQLVLNNYRGEVITIERNEFGKYAPITVIANNSRFHFSPEDRMLILSRFVFGINNPSVMRNLLGAFYFDQEKGWNVLNRGRVLGASRFSIEDFLCGLAGHDVSELKNKMQRLKMQLSEYTSVYKVAQLVNTPYSVKDSSPTDPSDASIESIKAKISSIDTQIKYFSHEISRLNRIFLENKAIGDYIASLHLCIKHNGESIAVTQDKIISFEDNQKMLFKRKFVLGKQIESLQKERLSLVESMETNYPDQVLIDKYKEKIAQIGLSVLDLERAINSLRINISECRVQLRNCMSESYHQFLNQNAIQFLDKLNIKFQYQSNYDVLLTHNLYPLSGAELYKHIVAFKLSYILAIKNKFGISLPIVIDSPYAHELDSTNFNNVMAIICEYFSEHQIIIASIRDELSNKHRKLIVSQGVLEYDLVVEDV